MNASGKLTPKLPGILYEPADMPKWAKQTVANYSNLHIYWSKFDSKGSEIAKQWMNEVFLHFFEDESVLIIATCTGYNQMIQM